MQKNRDYSEAELMELKGELMRVRGFSEKEAMEHIRLILSNQFITKPKKGAQKGSKTLRRAYLI